MSDEKSEKKHSEDKKEVKEERAETKRKIKEEVKHENRTHETGLQGRKRPSRLKYMAVFAVTTLIFIVGIMFGNYIASIKLDNIVDLQDNLKTETLAYELQYQLLSEDPCSAINSSALTDELYKIATRLDWMENQLGTDHPTVISLKEYYSLLEIRHWLFSKKAIKECNTKNTLVLYFYADNDKCPSCEEQGYVLTYIRRKYPSVFVYSFDANLENVALDTIKHLYDIDTVPAVVVDGTLMKGFSSKAQLEGIIEAK